MRFSFREEPNILIDDCYETLIQLLAVKNSPQTKIGDSGICRYCGQDDRKLFRKVAHTFPEGLGNKYFFSKDECDQCNELFSEYDDALCKSVGSLLTIFGIKSKDNKVRQTGRTKGSHNFKHGTEQVIFKLLDVKDNVQTPHGTAISSDGGKISVSIPTPDENFVPRYAYKCLIKAALAIMPEKELNKFKCLKTWLLTKDDDADFPFLDVGLAIRTEFDVKEMLSATLLKRKSPGSKIPHMLFVFCIGPICWQLYLPPDCEDKNCGLQFFGFINLNWTLSLDDKTGATKEISYPMPIHMDWRSKDAVKVPIENVILVIDGNETKKLFVDLRIMEP
jgi:hypothetical protein